MSLSTAPRSLRGTQEAVWFRLRSSFGLPDLQLSTEELTSSLCVRGSCSSSVLPRGVTERG